MQKSAATRTLVRTRPTASKKIYSINIMYFDFGSGEDYAYHGVTEFTGMTKKDAVLLPKSENEEKYIGKNIKSVTMPAR